MNNGEIAILVILFINLLLNAYIHGRPQKGNHNFWINLISSLIWIIMLKWAGLF